MGWGWSPDETGMSDDEDWPCEEEDTDDFELELQDCGRTEETDAEGYCPLMGSEQCEFRCSLRDELEQKRGPATS